MSYDYGLGFSIWGLFLFIYLSFMSLNIGVVVRIELLTNKS